MKTLYYLLGAILTLNSACEKDGVSPEATDFYWNETQCADPWVLEDNIFGAETADRVRTYLERRGIEVFAVEFEMESPLNPLCEACDCGTQRTIIVTVGERDAAAMEGLGFYR